MVVELIRLASSVLKDQQKYFKDEEGYQKLLIKFDSILKTIPQKIEHRQLEG